MLLEQLQESLGSAYTVDRELGGGGMSRVFLATENRFNRRVVVKVLSQDLAAGVSAERFEREIQLVARLQQANIVPLLATGDTNGLPYFTMPFVEGESLRARIAAHNKFSITETVSILRDVARAELCTRGWYSASRYQTRQRSSFARRSGRNRFRNCEGAVGLSNGNKRPKPDSSRHITGKPCIHGSRAGRR